MGFLRREGGWYPKAHYVTSPITAILEKSHSPINEGGGGEGSDYVSHSCNTVSASWSSTHRVVQYLKYNVTLSINFGLVISHTHTHIHNRPWHDARAIARARAITRANQEKGGLRGRWKARPKIKLRGLISPAQNFQ